MAKNYIWKTLAGVAVAGAAVGGALAYLKKCKDVNDLSEEDFEDLLNDEEDDACPAERTYTTLPTEQPAEDKTSEETKKETTEEADDTDEETSAEEETEPAEEETAADAAEEEVKPTEEETEVE